MSTAPVTPMKSGSGVSPLYSLGVRWHDTAFDRGDMSFQNPNHQHFSEQSKKLPEEDDEVLAS